MSATTQTFTGTLVVISCGECGVTFGLDQSFVTERKRDHRTWYCPNGHSRYYPGKTEEERQRERADDLERRLQTARRSEAFHRAEAATERRRAAARKGQVTRIRNLVAKGICPVAGCRRNFTNVREHMASEHPDYHLHDEAVRP